MAATGGGRRSGLIGALASLVLLSLPEAGLAEGSPISAIDWLSKSVTAPARPRPVPPGVRVRPAPGVAAGAVDEPPVAVGGALPLDVATTPLDRPSLDAVGLISPEVSGLPRDLWGAGLAEEIAQAITRDRMDSLPALRQLFLTMLLAEAEPPIDSGGRGILLQARIDKLLQIGALEQASALLDIVGTSSPALFRRAFDAAILTGNENRACKQMETAPGLAPTLQTRVFCLARGGEWDAAALTLHTARALGQVNDQQADLLERFLDPDLFEGEPVPPPPNPVTPLDWKIYEAVGETLPTTTLPVAFAYAEIGPQAGWKAQIEAAERLTRAGTIAPNVILGLYTERVPAASGGVWDRVDAFQDFDAAMRAGDPDLVAQTLPVVWARMQEVELEVPFAFLYARPLLDMRLSGEADRIALQVALISPTDFELAARHIRDEREFDDDIRMKFLVGIALGDLAGAPPPDSLARAIGPAFLAPELSVEAERLLEGRRLGEALLLAIEEIARGVEGDLTGVTRGLSLMRHVGLERIARRTALELMILERRG